MLHDHFCLFSIACSFVLQMNLLHLYFWTVCKCSLCLKSYHYTLYLSLGRVGYLQRIYFRVFWLSWVFGFAVRQWKYNEIQMNKWCKYQPAYKTVTLITTVQFKKTSDESGACGLFMCKWRRAWQKHLHWILLLWRTTSASYTTVEEKLWPLLWYFSFRQSSCGRLTF